MALRMVDKSKVLQIHDIIFRQGKSTTMERMFADAARRMSSGKILSEEEKAAENVYIKKIEQEKLEKLARKGPKPDEKPTGSSGGPVSDANPSGSTSGSSTAKVSTDKYRNYAVVAGVVTIGASLGWYLKSSGKKAEVQD